MDSVFTVSFLLVSSVCILCIFPIAQSILYFNGFTHDTIVIRALFCRMIGMLCVGLYWRENRIFYTVFGVNKVVNRFVAIYVSLFLEALVF